VYTLKGGITQNIGAHGLITGEKMTRSICFDHIAIASIPHPNQ